MALNQIASVSVGVYPDIKSFRSLLNAGLNKELSTLNQVAAGATRNVNRFDRSVVDMRRGVLAASLSVAGLRGAVLAAGTGFLGGAGLIVATQKFLQLAGAFEQQMNQLQAVTQATNLQLAAASELAKQLGADMTLPTVSAGDAATAMTELARGGFTVEESMAAARGALTLATAAQVDFATAAQIATRAINAFSLNADDSLRVADLLANAANASSGSITDMAFALQQSASAAAQAHVPIEDTVAAISILANAGIIGSDAGTSLRTTILRLIPATDKARSALRELGVSTTDFGGKLRSLPEIFEDFNRATQRMSQSQAQGLFLQIFGTDAFRAATLLTRAGAEGFDEMGRALDRQGAAAQLAAARTKGLAGNIDALLGNLQTLAIAASSGVTPAVTGIVKALNSQVTALANSEDAAAAAAGVWGTLTTTGRALGDTVSAVAPIVEDFAKVLATAVQTIGGSNLLIGIASFKALQVAVAATTKVVAGFNAAYALGTRAPALVKPANTAQITRYAAATTAAAASTQTFTNLTALLGRTTLQSSADFAKSAQGIAQLNAAEAVASGKVSAAAAARAIAIEAETKAMADLTAAKLAEAEGATIASAAEFEHAQALEANALASRAAFLENAKLNNIYATNTGALLATRGPLQGTVIGQRQLAEETARIEREMLRGARGTFTFGNALRNVGTGLLNFVGGPVNAAIIGVAALAAGLYFLSQRATDAEKAVDALKKAVGELGPAQKNLAVARREFANANQAVVDANNQLKAAKLEQREANIERNKSHATTLETEQAELRYQTALQQTRVAQAALDTALQQRQRSQSDFIAASERDAKVLDDIVRRTTKAANEFRLTKSEREFDKQAGVAITAANHMKEFQQTLRDLSKEFAQGNPLLARNLRLLGELATRLGRIPTHIEIETVLNNRELFNSIKIVNQRLGEITLGVGDLATRRRQIRVALGSTRGDIIDGVRGAWRGVSREAELNFERIYKDAAQKLLRGIVLESDIVARELKAQIHRIAREGAQEVANAVTEARANLLSIGTGLASQIEQLIDVGPQAREAERLQRSLDAANRAAQRLALTERISDAQQARRDAIDSTISTRPQSAEQQAAIKKFLTPFNRDVRDAQSELQRFTTEGRIKFLEDIVKAQKEAVSRGIADLFTQFNTGAITLRQFNVRLAALLQTAVPNYKEAGKRLGIAFVTSFNSQLDAVRQQVKALEGRTGGKQPGPGVVRPAETEAKVQRDIRDAQKKYQEADRKSQEDHTKLLKATITELKRKPNAIDRRAETIKRASRETNIELVTKSLNIQIQKTGKK